MGRPKEATPEAVASRGFHPSNPGISHS